MPADDRENRFEKALARQFRVDTNVAGASAFSTCGDAEILAAYHEQALPPAQMLSAKQHIEACTRCQEILANLAATDEIPLAANPNRPLQESAAAGSAVRVLKPSTAPLWRWVAPAGALAAALLVWVTVHGPTPQLQPKAPQQTMAAKGVPASPVPSPEPPPRDNVKNKAFAIAGATRTQTPPASPRREMSNLSAALSKDKESRVAPPDALALTDRNQSEYFALQQRYDSAAGRSDLDKNAQSVTGGISQLPRAEAKVPGQKNDVLAPSPKPAPPVGVAGGAVNGAVAETVQVAPAPQAQSKFRTEKAAAPPVASAMALQQEIDGTRRLNQEAQMRLANSMEAVTVSAPGGTVSWRIGAAGIIQYSSDAGKTWTLQPSGVINDLLAASAPSDKTCWIVGRAGTILRTTDAGAHWQRVRSPVQGDLLAVFAVDALQASVSPAAGTYQTTDAGATWHKVASE